MPANIGCEYHNDSRRIKAWTRHYIGKGCSVTKALKVAWNKCQQSSTWPVEA